MSFEVVDASTRLLSVHRWEAFAVVPRVVQGFCPPRRPLRRGSDSPSRRRAQAGRERSKHRGSEAKSH